MSTPSAPTQAQLEAAQATLAAADMDNPFTESSDLQTAWDTTKDSHLKATLKMSSVAAGNRLDRLLRVKIRQLQKHCNAEGASDLAIEMRAMLRRTY